MPSESSEIPGNDDAPSRSLTEFATRDAVPFDVGIEFGRSVLQRPLTVVRRGDSTGVRVLVIGAIHGDEADGTEVVGRLRTIPIPDGADLWLVPTVNPDGLAAGTRLNAHRIDLNRNFPPTWAPLGSPGDWEYAGPRVASEPETRAVVALGDLVRPDVVLWYHQDLNRISPATGRAGAIRARYAHLTGLPLVEVSGGTYTGTANRWGKSVVGTRGVSFTVELGPSLGDALAARHAEAVLTIAREFFP